MKRSNGLTGRVWCMYDHLSGVRGSSFSLSGGIAGVSGDSSAVSIYQEQFNVPAAPPAAWLAPIRCEWGWRIPSRGTRRCCKHTHWWFRRVADLDRPRRYARLIPCASRPCGGSYPRSGAQAPHQPGLRRLAPGLPLPRHSGPPGQRTEWFAIPGRRVSTVFWSAADPTRPVHRSALSCCLRMAPAHNVRASAWVLYAHDRPGV